MRSSKNRSRSKGNRNRSVGNIVNRVFDSSGPEGKVRGTPQQIIDKYNQLARDAQLANDRVAAENFQQHAEHYLRLLAEAQREQDARQQQNQQNQGGQQPNQGNQRRSDQGEQGDTGDQPRHDPPKAQGNDQSRQQPQNEGGERSFDSVIDNSGSDSTLVETPESQPKPKRTRRPRRKPTDEAEAKPQGDGEEGSGQPPQEAAE